MAHTLPSDVPTRGPLILLGNILPFLLATVFCACRVHSRANILRTWGSDDYLLVVGWLATFALCIMSCLGVTYGAGLHQYDLPPWSIRPTLQIFYGTLITYQASICLAKLSLCCLYLRVFNTTRAGRYLLYAIFAFQLLLSLACEAVSIFQCHPISGAWDLSQDASCISTIPAFYVSTIAGMVVDVALIAFAVPRILRLRLAPRQKAALLATSALGCLPVAASVIRCVRISEILRTTDRAWAAYDTSIWSAVDANVSLICAAAPAIKPLLRQLMPALLGSSFGASDRGRVAYGAGAGAGRSWRGTANRDTEYGFELHYERHLGAGEKRSEWSLGSSKMADEESSEEGGSVHDGGGILKSTRVTVRSVPQHTP